jgi:hypothetical protein
MKTGGDNEKISRCGNHHIPNSGPGCGNLLTVS